MMKPVFTKSYHDQKIIIRTKPAEYFIAFGAVVITAVIFYPLSDLIGYQTIGLLFLCLVAILSMFLSRNAVILAAVLNFVTWNYFFIPPVFTFHIHQIHDVIALFANLIIAITGGTLLNKIRKDKVILKQSQDRISVLFSLLDSLNKASSIKDVVNKARSEIKKHFSADMIIYLKKIEGSGLDKKAFGNTDLFSEKGYERASLFYDENILNVPQATGNEKIHYYSLALNDNRIGVIGLMFHNGDKVEEDIRMILLSFIDRITAALDREINIDLSKRSQIYDESQRLFHIVLNTISHELRTPIAIISAAISNLNDEKTRKNVHLKNQIFDELNYASARLNTLVENFLTMSRIESGYLKLHSQQWDVGDLVGIMCNQLKEHIQNHKVTTNVEENLPSVYIDVNWFKQALVNVLHNAAAYSPEQSEISISAGLNKEKMVVIEIADQGDGVPEGSLNKIFEKFYRLPGSKSGGMGLGLAISKAIIEAHNGVIQAKNRGEGGLSVSILLRPLDYERQAEQV
jgi:two-component system sensor histidine kinase KdpD